MASGRDEQGSISAGVVTQHRRRLAAYVGSGDSSAGAIGNGLGIRGLGEVSVVVELGIVGDHWMIKGRGIDRIEMRRGVTSMRRVVGRECEPKEVKSRVGLRLLSFA